MTWKYFAGCKNVETFRAVKKKMARELHSDKGGDDKSFREFWVEKELARKHFERSEEPIPAFNKHCQKAAPCKAASESQFEKTSTSAMWRQWRNEVQEANQQSLAAEQEFELKTISNPRWLAPDFGSREHLPCLDEMDRRTDLSPNDALLEMMRKRAEAKSRKETGIRKKAQEKEMKEAEEEAKVRKQAEAVEKMRKKAEEEANAWKRAEEEEMEKRAEAKSRKETGIRKKAQEKEMKEAEEEAKVRKQAEEDEKTRKKAEEEANAWKRAEEEETRKKARKQHHNCDGSRRGQFNTHQTLEMSRPSKKKKKVIRSGKSIYTYAYI